MPVVKLSQMTYHGRSNRSKNTVAKSSGYKSSAAVGGLYDKNTTAIGEKSNPISEVNKSEAEINEVKAQFAKKIQERNKNTRIAIITFAAIVAVSTLLFLAYN